MTLEQICERVGLGIFVGGLFVLLTPVLSLIYSGGVVFVWYNAFICKWMFSIGFLCGLFKITPSTPKDSETNLKQQKEFREWNARRESFHKPKTQWDPYSKRFIPNPPL